MRRLLFGIVAFGLLFGVVRGQERITLTAPETVSNTQYHIRQIQLDYDAGTIRMFLVGDQNGQAVMCGYDANSMPTGATLLTGLNKANLSSAYAGNATTGSLTQRIYHRLVVMGEASAVCGGKSLAGTLTGSVP